MIEKLKEEAKKMVEELKEKFPCIIGASISGSISIGLADEFSDIDIDIWLREEDYKQWAIEETCPLMKYFAEFEINRETPTDFSFIKGDLKFDISVFSIERVEEDAWTIEQKATHKDSIIVHDTDDIIKKLIEKKTANSNMELESKGKRSNESPWPPKYYSFYISAYLNYFCPIAVVRKDYGQAHFNLNQTIHFILEHVWVRETGCYPYEKSLWAIEKKAMTEIQKKLLEQASIVKEYSAEDISRRRNLLKELCSKLNIPITKFYHHKTSLD